MVTASQLRTGMAIRFDHQPYRIVGADYQPGQGKMGGVMHARLKNLATGTTWEHGFRAELKLEEIQIDKRPADFLYQDGPESTFMDPNTFEQYTVPTESLGPQGRLLAADMRVTVEMLEGAVVSIQLPPVMETAVIDTAPATHGTQDSTWKPARVANGIEILVPQFIRTGDVIRLDTVELKYMERARAATR